MIEILLVENNKGHALLIRKALQKFNGEIRVTDVVSGEEALAYLEEGWADLILLDLNLPGLYGLEILQALKADARLRRIPVVILTTSRAETDIVTAYDAQAAGYVVKPVNFEKLVEVSQYISGFYKKVEGVPYAHFAS